MVYLMSDIHGQYKKYIKMLKRIKLAGTDTLYILGDVVDRGPDGIKILLDIAERKNVIFVKGNHDDIALKVFRCLHEKNAAFKGNALIEVIRNWMLDGGKPTLEHFLSLSREMQDKVIRILSSGIIFDEIEIDGQEFFLAHSVPEVEQMLDSSNWTLNDFLWGEPDYECTYYQDKIIVTGHTPTELIDKACAGHIYIRNNHIAIDCGAGFGGPLGCICLNTMEEYYV